MVTEPQLFADVVAAPTDDGPRLVYADWLQQQDDPIARARGEYIALACSSTRSPKRTARLDELLAKHEAAWLGPLATVTEHRIWDRGFVEECQLLAHACPADALAHPLWQTLRVLHELPGFGAGQPRVIRAPRLANLKKLATNERMLVELAGSEHAPHVTELAVARGDVHPDLVVRMLATEPCFARVTRLHMERLAVARADRLARPGLTLAVDATGAIGSWFQWLATTTAELREVRLVRWRGSSSPLFVREGYELVLTRDPRGRFTALDVRWTEHDDERHRARLLDALDRLPPERLTRVTFSGPPRAAFDVARWKTRVRQALRAQTLAVID
jgi:uncharacterized protein (TIGR02996 family)